MVQWHMKRQVRAGDPPRPVVGGAAAPVRLCGYYNIPFAVIRRTIFTEVSSIMPTNVVELFKLNKFPNMDSRIGVIVLAGLLSAGCVFVPSEQDTQAGSAAAAPAPSSPAQPEASASELPDVNLDADLLYKVLLGEIAAKRGDGDTAADSLMDAARISQDPRLAERATQVALGTGRFDLATDAASLWVDLEPDRPLPRESLALIMVEQGRIEEAGTQFNRLVGGTDSPDGAELRRIAQLLSQLSNKENALAAMKLIVAEHEDNADAHFAEAFLADRVGRNKLVGESLDRALALRPDWEEAALARLGNMIQNQDPKEGIDAFALGFLENTPESVRVRISYARYLVDQQISDQALEQFRQVLEHDPDNTTGLMSAGLLSIQEERYGEARKYLEQHLELTPDNDQIRLYLGQIAEERERYDEAEQWYREVRDPEQLFNAGLHLATVIHEREGVDAALEHLDSVNPGDEDEFVRLALTKELVLRRGNELQRAKTVLDDAVARYPGNNDLLYARGLLAARLNRIGEHEKDMRTLLEENPNNANALNALGYTLADATDRVDEAYDLVSKALKMRPDDPFILDSMGWVHYRLGNHRDAIEYLERALSQREDAEIAAHLGEVLWVVGDKERARDIWQRARREDPDNHVLNETIQRFTQ